MNRFNKLLLYFGLKIFFLLTIQLPSAQSSETLDQQIQSLVKGLASGKKVAVSWIYDRATGDVTELSDLWWDKIEGVLSQANIAIVARRDLKTLINEAEVFGNDTDGLFDRELTKLGADWVITGRYSVVPPKQPGQPHRLKLHLSTIQPNDGRLIRAIDLTISLDYGWRAQTANIRWNIYHPAIKKISLSDPVKPGPAVTAKFNKENACFLPKEPVTITINTEIGAYLYLINLAADSTAALLYPNRIMRNQPVKSTKFVFPPPSLANAIQLIFQPMPGERYTQESIKIIASRTKLHFSFLPFPENQVFIGAKGGDLKKMLNMLQNASAWREQTLTYWVGDSCR